MNIDQCSLCPESYKSKEESELVKLKCHSFCWTCLDKYLRDNLNSKIKCPHNSCSKFIPDNVIRKTMSEDNVLKYENLCLESLQQAHCCLLPKCNNIIFYSDPNIQYECQICSLYNCIICNAAHAFVTCTNYQSLTDERKKRVCSDEMKRAEDVLKGIQRQKMRDSLRRADDEDLLVNDHAFSCWLCSSSIAKECGVKLRDCWHTFCRPCLNAHIVACTVIPAKCPMGCRSIFSDREIQTLLTPEQMVIYQGKYTMLMKRRGDNYFQCKYPNCDSIYYYTERPPSFTCVKCNHVNCVPCEAVHDTETCQDFKDRTESSVDAKFIAESIQKKMMMKCPDCQHLLYKTRGCNWIQCDRCLVELCWIRQMHRWGPKGRGDITGGCGCGINRQFCHPDCRGCIPDLR